MSKYHFTAYIYQQSEHLGCQAKRMKVYKIRRMRCNYT